MAATSYSLTAADWADCGAADDCTLQIPEGGGVSVTFTIAPAKPGAGVRDGLRLACGPGEMRSATIQKPGQKLWARCSTAAINVIVER